MWALESKLLPCVVRMEATGIHVDRAKLESIAAEADRLAQQAADDLRTALGNPSINPGSPGQVLAALRAKGLKLESTAEEALKAADDGHLVPLVLAHREASKRAQQAESLVGHIQNRRADPRTLRTTRHRHRSILIQGTEPPEHRPG